MADDGRVGVTWDIDANLPLYTRDYLKHLNDFVLGYRVGDRLYHPADVTIVANSGANPPMRQDDHIRTIVREEVQAMIREENLKRHMDLGHRRDWLNDA